jgi:hypothetical protein
VVERASSPLQRCAVYTRKSSEEGLEQDFDDAPICFDEACDGEGQNCFVGNFAQMGP